MLLIRDFETEAERQYKAARIGGYCHLSSGQEAATVGATHALDADDLLVTGYRCHGFALARGVPPEAVMAELFGRVDGCAHGRGGSMHLLDVDLGYYGGWGIVAGQLPLATGLALGARAPGARAGRALRARRRRDQHGRLARVAEPRGGLAAAGRLPRDEQRVRHGHERRARLRGDRALPPRGAYGLPAERVDGDDLLAVAAGRGDAARRAAREERQAAVLELVTYRYRGHSVADAGLAYRTRGEIDEHLRHDPIFRVRELLAEEGVSDGSSTRCSTTRRERSRRRSSSRSRVPRRRSASSPRHVRAGQRGAVRADAARLAVRRARARLRGGLGE